MSPAQGSLFVAWPETARARKTDGPTQKAAAKAMAGHILREQQAIVLEAVAACQVRGANAHEVQTWLRDRGRNAPERNAVGSRFRELVEKGLVRLDRTRPGPTGQPEKVYVATEDGRKVIAAVLAERGVA